MLLLLFAALAAAAPEQVHISLTKNPTEMAVSWVSMQPESSTVEYSRPNCPPITIHGTESEFDYNGHIKYIHKAVMTGLDYDTEYTYKVGGSAAWSQSFTFKTLSQNPQDYKVCVFGDLGVFHGESIPSLLAAAQRREFDVIIHVGDIAYDLHSNTHYGGEADGSNGDEYMRKLEPMIATIPYMVIAGNHEDDGKNFSHYRNRFAMPDEFDGLMYSFDLGPIHFVGVNTENYGFYYEYGMESVTTQYNWLKKDLEAANANRHNRPWIISFQHRPFYCSNSNSDECASFENRLVRMGFLDMKGLEPLFIEQNMDIGFWGHEHSYERFLPTADMHYYNDPNAYHNAKAPVYVITGSAGCHSGHAFFGKPLPWSARRVNDYGYSILHVTNATHLHFQQISIEKNDAVVDDIWFSKDPSFTRPSHPPGALPFLTRQTITCHARDTGCKRQLQRSNDEM